MPSLVPLSRHRIHFPSFPILSAAACSTSTTDDCDDQLTALELFVSGCSAPLTDFVELGKCPAHQECTCGSNAGDLGHCDSNPEGQLRPHVYNVPASARFDGLGTTNPKNIPRVPSNGLFKYQLHAQYVGPDENVGYGFADFSVTVSTSLQHMLSLQDLTVTVDSIKFDEHNGALVGLSLKMPDTATLKDLLNVNILLHTSHISDIFQLQDEFEATEGFRDLDSEITDPEINALFGQIQNHAQTKATASNVALYSLMGGLFGIAVGAAAIYLFKKKQSGVITDLEAVLNESNTFMNSNLAYFYPERAAIPANTNQFGRK